MEEMYLASLQGMAPRMELADEVYNLLRGHIMRGTIPPGVRINIDDVARQLSVSPTPVRESLARLESEGLVDRQPRRGYRATELLEREDVVDLYELRLLLEPHAAERAVEGGNAALLDAMAAEVEHGLTLADSTGAVPPAELSAHDERFHDLVFQAAGNEMIRQSYARMHCHLHIFRLAYSDTYDNHTIMEHGDILAALRAGKAAAAGLAMRKHLTSSEVRVLKYFDSQKVPAAPWSGSGVKL